MPDDLGGDAVGMSDGPVVRGVTSLGYCGAVSVCGLKGLAFATLISSSKLGSASCLKTL